MLLPVNGGRLVAIRPPIEDVTQGEIELGRFACK
jgi:hypothetical protein